MYEIFLILFLCISMVGFPLVQEKLGEGYRLLRFATTMISNQQSRPIGFLRGKFEFTEKKTNRSRSH